MKSIGLVMIEHKVIKDILEILQNKLNLVNKTQKIDLNFLEKILDFFKIYVDESHYGKEEIFYYELGKKNLTFNERKIMNELLEEHNITRKLITDLKIAKEKYVKDNSSLVEIVKIFNKIIHIEKEDKLFFPETTKYFTSLEQEILLKKCEKFDSEVLHGKYKKLFENLYLQKKVRVFQILKH